MEPKTLKPAALRLPAWIMWLSLASGFAALMLLALAKGGRWDLYEAMFMADRLLAGHTSYSNGMSDGLLPSTPYFPGITFLSAFVQLILPGFHYQVELLLFIAVGFVFVLLLLFYWIYHSWGGLQPRLGFMAMALGFVCIFYSSWLGYAIEHKPDTLALIGVLIAMLQLMRSEGATRHLLFFCGLTLAFLLKQQIIAPVAGMMLGVLLSHRSATDKCFLVIVAGAAFAAAMAVTFEFDNAWAFAVHAHAGKPRLPLLEVLIAHRKLIVLFAAFAAAFWYMGERRVLGSGMSVLQRHPYYALAMVLWMIGGIASAVNDGGTAGNTSVGLLLFLPLLLLFADTMPRPVTAFLQLVPILVLAKVALLDNSWASYRERVATDHEIAQQLTQHKATNLLVSGDSLMSVRNYHYEQLHELDAWAHLVRGSQRKTVPATGSELVELLKPDAIVCVNGCDAYASYGLSLEGYKEIELASTAKRQLLYIRERK